MNPQNATRPVRPRIRLRLPHVALLGAALLSACALAGIRVRQDVAHQYLPSTLGRIGTGEHQLRVDIRQKPFAVSDAEFAAEVVDGMQGATNGIPVNFATAPENPYPRGNYRTVLLFNPPPGTSSLQICKSQLDQIAPPGPLALVNGTPEIRLFGAYCQGDLALTRVSARAVDIDDPRSERFDQFMSQVSTSLFPPTNRNLEEDRCDRLPFLCR